MYIETRFDKIAEIADLFLIERIDPRDLKAAKEFVSRKERWSHPDCHFDKAGRAYLLRHEDCPGCKYVRSPSRAYPYSEMVHGRTAEHVAGMLGGNTQVTRRVAHIYCKFSMDPDVFEEWTGGNLPSMRVLKPLARQMIAAEGKAVISKKSKGAHLEPLLRELWKETFKKTKLPDEGYYASDDSKEENSQQENVV